MKGKRQIRGKSLQGTPYFISQDEKLGTGSYGSVYKAYNKQNPNEELVAKVISLLDQDNQESIKAEMEVIRELPRHQNLVNCLKAHIVSQTNLYIIMEYCNQGSLTKFIEKKALVPEDRIWDFILQIAKGYQVLHDANLLHRDIKPDNILIHNQVFKLADFGLAKHITAPDIKQNLSYAGSPLYMAPQITDKNVGSSKVDVFSLGSVVYQLAYDGTQPFYRQPENYKDPQEYYRKRKTMKLKLNPRNKKGESRSEQLRNLLQSMLEFDQQKRISWEQIFGHPRIDINKMKPELKLQRIISHQEEELQCLRRSLIEVSRSSATIEALMEKPNARQQSRELTLQLIAFEQFLQHKELRSMEHKMFRLKITQLTILYANGKILEIMKDQLRNKSLHPHIFKCLQNLLIQGLLYLIRVNDLISANLTSHEQSVVKQLLCILAADRQKLVAEFKKELRFFKSPQQLQNQLLAIKSYGLRRYQDQLYNFLTEYCDYPVQTKHKLAVSASLLVDVYDSSLKLSFMVQSDRMVWQKYQDMSQIQTKMDEICYNKLQPHEFHSYLMDKGHVRLEQIDEALRKVGLLFA